MSHKLLSTIPLLVFMARAPATPARPATSEAAVRAMAERYAAAHNRDDAEAVAALFAPNGVFVSPDSRMEGRSAIPQMIAASVAEQENLSFLELRTRASGDLAVNEGVASYTSVNASGQRDRIQGDFVSELARQPDGRWKAQTLIVGNFKQTPAQWY